MSHTEGKLSIEIKNVAIADTGDYEGLINVKDASGKIVFQIWGDDESDELRARRIVACWNACEGVPADTLERVGLNWGRIEAVKQERDEALEALRKVIKYANRKPFNLTKEIDAILAKHQKGTDHAK